MSPPTSKNPSALPAAPRHRPSSAVPPTTTTLTSQPHSRGSTQPLPQYYIQRPGSTHHTATGTVSTPGTNVPLIAADQLPAWVDVLGVPRELSPEQTATLSSLGTVPKGGSYELYISPAGLSTAAAAAVPGSMGKQQQQQPVKQKGLAASRHNPVNSGSGGGGGNGGSGGHSGQQAMNSTGRTTSAPGIGSVSRNHHRPQTGLHERQAPPAPPATRPSNPYPVMWTTAAARQRRYEARRRAHAQAGLQRQRQRSLPLHPVERLRALYTATASTLRNARSGSAENNNSSPPIIPPRSPSSSSSLMSFSSSSSSSSSCSSSSSSSAASTTTKTPQKHSKSSIGHTKEKKNDKKKDEEKEKEKEKGKEKNRDNTSSSSSAQKSQKASSNNASNNTSNNSSSNGGRQTTSYCRNWCRTGRCRFGARCRYLHMMPRTAQELRDAGLTDYPRWWLTHLELMAQYVQDLPVSASAATKEGTGESPLELLEDMMMMTMPGFFPAPSQGAQQQGQQPPRNHARVQALMQQIIEATASSPLPSASSASHSSSGRGEKQKEKPAASAPQKQEQQKHRRGRGAKDAENENERAENYPHSGSSSRSNEDGPAASTAMSKVKVKDKDNNGLQNGANDTVVAKAAKKPSSKESDHSGETRGTACAVPPSPKHMNTSGSNNVSSNTIVPTDTARSPSHNAAGIREGGSGGGEGGKSMATSTLVSETVSAAGGPKCAATSSDTSMPLTPTPASTSTFAHTASSNSSTTVAAQAQTQTSALFKTAAVVQQQQQQHQVENHNRHKQTRPNNEFHRLSNNNNNNSGNNNSHDNHHHQRPPATRSPDVFERELALAAAAEDAKWKRQQQQQQSREWAEEEAQPAATATSGRRDAISIPSSDRKTDGQEGCVGAGDGVGPGEEDLLQM